MVSNFNILSPGLRGIRVWIGLCLWMLGSSLFAQPVLTFLETVPAGQTITRNSVVTVSFEIQPFDNPVEVNFFRNDGSPPVTQIFDPVATPNPVQATLSLITGQDRALNQFDTVAMETGGGAPNPQFNFFSIVSDQVGPANPTIVDPVFPVTTFQTSLTVQGNVLNTGSAANSGPETGGQVIFQRASDNAILGSAAIGTDSSFTALLDLNSIPLDTATDLNVFALDAVANPGTTATVQVTRQAAAAPMLMAEISPLDGTLTNNPAVTISGTITGDIEPLAVNVFIDTLLSARIQGLRNGENFSHTVNLPGEGNHQISVQAVNGTELPDPTAATLLGSIEVDLTPPAAPVLLEPNQSTGFALTNQPGLILRGFLGERDRDPDADGGPRLELRGPPGMTFNPASPLTLDAATGEFLTMAEFVDLPDGNYSIDLIAVDEAGNSNLQSILRLNLRVDRTAPAVDRIRVNGVLAPSANPEVYVGQTSVPIEVTFTEPIVDPPDLFVTQNGVDPTPTGVSSQTTRTVTYIHGVTPGSDGPANLTLSGGEDRAGNAVNESFDRVFVIDTTPPAVASVDPGDITTLVNEIERVRVRLFDPATDAGTFVGVDLEETTITLQGPIESGPQTVIGTLTPFDPFTLDFLPAQALVPDGSYQVTVVPVDRVGNRAFSVTRRFEVDATPIALNSTNVIANPPPAACINEENFPGGQMTPQVQVTVLDPQFDPVASELVVRDFCRVPPEIPGTKMVIDEDTIAFVFDQPLATDGSQDGVYAIQLDAIDRAGNQSPTFTTTFTFDTLEPSVSQTFPTSNAFIEGPLRIVDATLLDPNRDFCRSGGRIEQDLSGLRLILREPNPNVNTKDPGTRVRGTLRFDHIGSIERMLLEIVDQNGVPTGLATDGSDDGVYELSVDAFDCATNTPGTHITTFTYDSIRPVLEVRDLADGATLSGSEFVLQGRLVDNAGGSGIDRVTVTLESLGPSGEVTGTFFNQEEAEIDPAPLGAVDPRVNWIFRGDLRRVPKGTTGRLVVRGFDRAGNSEIARFRVTAMLDEIAPIRTSSPRSNSVTSVERVTFQWLPNVQASRYRVRIQTPNGDQILRETEDASTQLTVNLNGLPDPEGRFVWAVAALDGVGGQGAFSASVPFFVDRTRPKLKAVDLVDPTPESNGRVNEGLIRVSLRFNEDMDTDASPTVFLRSERPGLPDIPVEEVSYEGDTWQGEAFLREASPDHPDYNGLARVRILGARDRGGNVLLEPLNGIDLFEIDTGPYFKVALFRNPIDDQDLIMVVKGFSRKDGPIEPILEPPTVLVQREGQSDQTPEVYRIHEAAFRTHFRLDRRYTTPVTVTVHGRDEQGNAARRVIPLDVARLRPGAELKFTTQALQIAVPPRAASQEVTATLLEAPFAIPRDLTGTGLEGAICLAHLGPAPIPLEQEAEVQVLRSSIPGSAEGMGLYVDQGEAGLRYLGQDWDQDSLRVRSDLLGNFYLARDVAPPQLQRVEPTWSDGVLEIQVAGQDLGSGLDPSRSQVRVLGESFPLVAEGAGLRAEVRRALRGGEAIQVELVDRAGNSSGVTQALVPAPALGFSEVSSYPNPARTSTIFRYRLNQRVDEVILDIRDTAGRRVHMLRGPGGAGLQTVLWDLRGRRGRVVRNGVYFVEIRTVGQGRSQRERLKLAVLR